MTGKTILVVDDEAHILHVVSLKLQNAGFNVVTANDGEEAGEAESSGDAADGAWIGAGAGGIGEGGRDGVFVEAVQSAGPFEQGERAIGKAGSRDDRSQCLSQSKREGRAQ